MSEQADVGHAIIGEVSSHRKDADALLLGLARSLLAVRDSSDVATLISEQIVPIAGARSAVLALTADADAPFSSVTANGVSQQIADSLSNCQSNPLLDCIVSRTPVALTGLADKLAHYPQIMAECQGLLKEGPICAIPLLVDQTVLGALCLIYTQDSILDENIRGALSAAASLCAAALFGARSAEQDRKALIAAYAEIERTRFCLETAIENEEGLRLALRCGDLGTWELDVESGTFTTVADNSRRHFGVSDIAPLTYTSLMKTIHPEDREVLNAQFASAMDRREGFEAECRVYWPDGSLHWVSTQGHPMAAADGRPNRIIGVSRDISVRKEAEAERNRRLRDAEVRAAELTESYLKEHRIADALQRSLLNEPLNGMLKNLEVKTIYMPAWDEADVGGDYHDCFALSDGNIALVVADISGKGLDAASRTSQCKYGLRAYLFEQTDPASALSLLNRFLCNAQLMEGRPDDGEFFVAVSIAVVDPQTGVLRIASAGVEPPMIVHAGGGYEEVAAGGLPVGVSLTAEYQTVTTTLTAGDVLMIATDGFTEARRQNDFLGNRGLVELAESAMSLGSLNQIAALVVAGVEAYAGGALRDDACLLLARRT